MNERNAAPQSTTSEKQGGHKEHKEHKEHKANMSLSVFIGVYRWLKNAFHHRCTPMNTDKSLMKIPGECLLSLVPCPGQVTP
jgi:hypothetical protein